jgi:peptidyl-prolyl cis-trans isomerase-like 4
LNPVTRDEDLELIFSRFGKILSCEVIRDKKTGDSLQYAFIEFANKEDTERAYFKMQGVLIDDHRIHVDFSQSVSRLADAWRDTTNSKTARKKGGFGGIAGLEAKRHYREGERYGGRNSRGERYDYVFDKDGKRIDGDKDDRDRESPARSPRRDRDRDPSRRDDMKLRKPSPKRGNRERERSPRRDRDPRRDDRRDRDRDDRRRGDRYHDDSYRRSRH